MEALELTLKKYVNLNNLKEKINEYDDKLISFYKERQVSFSKGNPVNLDSNDEKQIYSNLASRIYQTRNALVHSKDTDKSKYLPFKHDKILMKEVPLMRFIAEDIIIQTSQLI